MKHFLVGMFAVALIATNSSWAVDGVFIDTKDQSIDVKNVQTTAQVGGTEYLTVTSGAWIYSLHLTLVSQVESQPEKKDKNVNGMPVKVTLTSKEVVEGTNNNQWVGQSDFGQAKVDSSLLKSARFMCQEKESPFKPSTEWPQATVIDKGGKTVELSNVRFSISQGGNQPSISDIVGTRGAATLEIPAAQITLIELKGVAGESYARKVTWRVTLANGKSTELELSQSYEIKGDFVSGVAAINAADIKSVVFSKKK